MSNEGYLTAIRERKAEIIAKLSELEKLKKELDYIQKLEDLNNGKARIYTDVTINLKEYREKMVIDAINELGGKCTVAQMVELYKKKNPSDGSDVKRIFRNAASNLKLAGKLVGRKIDNFGTYEYSLK